MYCSNCGNKLGPDEHICSKCGSVIIQKISKEEVSKDNNINNDASATALCNVSLLLTIGTWIIIYFGFQSSISIDLGIAVLMIGPLLGLVLAIIAKVKYPNSTYAKTLMSIYIALIIIIVVILIFVMASCFPLFESCSI